MRYFSVRPSGCGCGLAHATRDEYFVKNNFKPNLMYLANEAAGFFGISPGRASHLFFYRPGYSTRADMLASLRVLLLEVSSNETGMAERPYAELELESASVGN
jgi:hypothetical protein